ncbi:histidine ammonia-lyase, partial [Staphylococcus equorum]
MTLRLTGDQLSIHAIREFLAQQGQIEVTADALQRVRQSRATVERIIQNKETIYGITTGFGLFSDVLIDQQKYNQLQVNLIRSHACGV